jgi:TolA-binding protein
VVRKLALSIAAVAIVFWFSSTSTAQPAYQPGEAPVSLEMYRQQQVETQIEMQRRQLEMRRQQLEIQQQQLEIQRQQLELQRQQQQLEFEKRATEHNVEPNP